MEGSHCHVDFIAAIPCNDKKERIKKTRNKTRKKLMHVFQRDHVAMLILLRQFHEMKHLLKKCFTDFQLHYCANLDVKKAIYEKTNVYTTNKILCDQRRCTRRDICIKYKLSIITP